MKQRIRLLAVAVCLAAWQVACGGSGGGSINPTPPTITSVAVSPATATVATGKTATFTASVAGTGSYSSSVTWTASAGTISSSGVLTAPGTSGTVTVTATSTEDLTKKGTATVTVVTPLSSVTITAASSTVNAGGTDALSAAVTGGTGKATVVWSVGGSSVGSLSPTSGLTTTYTAPATVSASTTVTITATATDATGSVTGTASITVQRAITISFVPAATYPNSEIYSDFGGAYNDSITCTGCITGDTLNGQSTYGDVFSTTSFGGALNFIGNASVPGPVSLWVTGADGAKSNTLWLTYDGSENVAVEDSTSGEIYYAYSGNGTQGSFSVLKFKRDGTADGSFGVGGFGIAVDNQTRDVVFAQIGDITVWISDGTQITTVDIPQNPSSTNALAISASGGLGCATQPTIDSVSCLYLPTQPSVPPVFSLPGIPSGSQPAAIKVLDASHVVLYGRGDQTLRWLTISGTTATAAGTLQLSEFTPIDANYWKTYPATGGWGLVEVGSTLCVMGQVVNSDGTVSQKLALVSDTNQSLIQYADLPDGTVHIAADPTNNAIVAEYVDFSGASPVTRFERIYVDTGNSVLLTSTSNLVPGAGFLVTNDGSHIAVFVEGKADFEPNQ